MYWRFHQNTKVGGSLLLPSVVASFVINQTFSLIAHGLGVYSWSLLAPVGFALLLAFLLGRCVDIRIGQWLFDKIGIRRTWNRNIWNDLIEPEKRNCVKIFDETGFYVGTCVAFEDDQREPCIILEGYERCDFEGNTVITANLSGDRRMMFNLKDFQRVEVVYSDD